MKKRTIFFAVFVITCAINTLSGQGLSEKYMSEAEINAIFYRGPIQMKLPFRFNGTFYAFSENYMPGDLWYNNKYYKGVSINLDAYTDELYIRASNISMTVVLQKNLVEKFTFNNMEFTNITGQSQIKGLSKGYYQIIYSGNDTLLKKIKKECHERPDQIDAKRVYRFFEESISYILIKNNTIFYVARPNSFSKLYKERKSEIQKFLKISNLKHTIPANYDNSFKTIMQFIEGNQN